ncbi:MAG: sigma factor [Blastocatellia bacterium]
MLTEGQPAVFDCGISAEDLVTETLEQFFESPNRLNWKPSKSKLGTFLCMILERRFIDHLRRQKFVAGSLDEEETHRAFAEQPSGAPNPYQQMEYKDFADLMRAEVKGHQELKDLITASEMIHDETKVNEQLAEIMGIPKAKVMNLKKQLVRNRGIKDLYEQRRK